MLKAGGVLAKVLVLRLGEEDAPRFARDASFATPTTPTRQQSMRTRARGLTRGRADFEEFLQMMTAKMGADTKEDVMKVFAAYDTEGSGSITFANLRRVAKELGENLTDDELQEMLNHADKTGNGGVSMDDFYRLMKKQQGNKLDDLLGEGPQGLELGVGDRGAVTQGGEDVGRVRDDASDGGRSKFKKYYHHQDIQLRLPPRHSKFTWAHTLSNELTSPI